jgi:syntaxin-binding protein 1
LATFAIQVRPKLVEKIKGSSSLIRNIKALKESNLEFLLVDSRTVTTEHPDALVR